MAIPVPHTWLAGTDNATSGNMQTLTDTGLFLLGSATSTSQKRALFRGRNTTGTQTYTSGTTGVAVTFDVEDYDYDANHSTVTNTSRFTAVEAGAVWVRGHIGTSAPAAGGGTTFGNLWFAINGTEVNGSRLQIDTNTARGYSGVISDILYLNAADYLELWFAQNSGGSVTAAVTAGFQPSLTAMWVSN